MALELEGSTSLRREHRRAPQALERSGARVAARCLRGRLPDAKNVEEAGYRLELVR
jgi:hypothetical protein